MGMEWIYGKYLYFLFCFVLFYELENNGLMMDEKKDGDKWFDYEVNNNNIPFVNIYDNNKKNEMKKELELMTEMKEINPNNNDNNFDLNENKWNGFNFKNI